MANIDLIQRRVLICAGHGGGDPGAIGQGTTEAAECIDIANRVVDFLRKDGQLAVEHCPNEHGFTQAISWVNQKTTNIDFGVFVDIHKNSFHLPAKGIECWYADDADSKEIAARVQSMLAQYSGLASRGIKPDTLNRFGRLGSLRDTNTWAVLIEAGFVSDGGDPVGAAANARYAEAISRGLLNIWKLTPKPAPVVSTPPPPVPAPVTWTYKVVSTADGKQLGVYNTKTGAWTKYTSVSGAAKILDASGNDLTPSFSLEFNPPAPPPVPQPQHPITEKDYTDADRARDNAMFDMIKTIYEYFAARWTTFQEFIKKK